MSYGIDQLKGLMNAKGGIARPNLFRVELESLPGATSRDVNLLCTAVNLPGKGIITYDRDIGIRRDKIAYGQIYEDLQLRFLLLNDYGIRKYFERWMELTVSTDYQINYKNQYAKQIKVAQLKKGFGMPVYSTPLGIPRLPAELQNLLPKIGPFDFAQGELDLDFITGDKDVYTMTFEDVFPTGLVGTTLDNASNDQIEELTVTLAYTRFTTTTRAATPIQDFLTTQIGSLASRLLS